MEVWACLVLIFPYSGAKVSEILESIGSFFALVSLK